MSHFTTFSQEELDQTVPPAPDWYNVKITNFEKKLSKDGASDNFILSGEIVSNDKGDTKFAGRKIVGWWGFNSKMMGMAKGLWESLGIEIKAGTKVDWEALKGRTVCVFIEQQEYQGAMGMKMTNKYKKVGA